MSQKQHAIAANAEQLDELFRLFKEVEGIRISGSSPEEVRANFRLARKARQNSEGTNAGLA